MAELATRISATAGRLRATCKRLLARWVLVIEFCQDCGRRQPLVWTAGDPLWAAVMERSDGGGVVCLECFDRRAAVRGIRLRWVPTDESGARDARG